MIKEIIYVIRVTLEELVLLVYGLIDFILPDFTIFSPVRKMLAGLFWKVGKKTRIRKEFNPTKLGNLSIGNNCFINRKNLFDNGALIKVGNNCSIGYDNKFITVSHVEKDKKRENNKTFFFCPIKIGNNVWITTNCVILPGTEIGDNVILSANSVARGKLEFGWVYGGNPAIKIRKTKGIIPKVL
jgi:acetyltransferase-like isoleucine patch superfamily enzyme